MDNVSTESVTRYRVWWVPQIPMPSFKYEVPDLATARLVTDLLAKYDLFQYENNVKPDYANVGGVQRWDDELSEWCEVDDDEESEENEK